jgi:hypothetical protein
MARSEIHVCKPLLNGSAAPTKTAIGAGMTGTAGCVVQDSYEDTRFSLIIDNLAGTTGLVTLKASDALEGAGQGDKDYLVPAEGEVVIGPIDGMRFRQSTTGYINVDIGAGVTGSAYALELSLK